ncbi:hypothetical protein BDZ97DRAFT_1761272 [Flammula alnicola]|nr:hypothetical protein BDZ97DRAFT_1761272 [Flammula alnicola]
MPRSVSRTRRKNVARRGSRVHVRIFLFSSFPPPVSPANARRSPAGAQAIYAVSSPGWASTKARPMRSWNRSARLMGISSAARRTTLGVPVPARASGAGARAWFLAKVRPRRLVGLWGMAAGSATGAGAGAAMGAGTGTGAGAGRAYVESGRLRSMKTTPRIMVNNKEGLANMVASVLAVLTESRASKVGYDGLVWFGGGGGALHAIRYLLGGKKCVEKWEKAKEKDRHSSRAAFYSRKAGPVKNTWGGSVA